jgi:hypothetical protein
MKISAIHYYLGVVVLFLIASYFAHGTEYYNYLPLFYLLFGFGGFILRYIDSMNDLNTHVKIYHRNIFNQHADRWIFATKSKRLYPMTIFGPDIQQSTDPELKNIGNRAKMNLIFLIVSFISFPILTALIMILR